MTKKSLHPAFPPELPSNVGASYCDVYRSTREAMITSAEAGAPENVIAALATQIAGAVSHDTPKASAKLKAKFWALLREWNKEREPSGTTFRCERCGEHRDDNIECEGIVTRHAQLVSVLDSKSETGATHVVVKPEGCQHTEFLIVCRSCGLAHEGYEPLIEKDDKRTSDHSIN